MDRGKKVRLRIKTNLATYTGDFLIQSAGKGFSGEAKASDNDFINLTDVEVDGTSTRIMHLSLSKHLVDSIRGRETGRQESPTPLPVFGQGGDDNEN